MVESCWQLAAAVLFQLLHCSLGQTETAIVDSVEVKGANKSGLSSNSLLAFKTGTFLDNTEARVRLLLHPIICSSVKIIQAILGGVIGFWGGVFCMGSIFLTMVLVKRCINRKLEEDE